MELTDNDKQRIEQANRNEFMPYKAGWIAGAEYATIYEREQQAMPKPCHFCGGNGFIMGYENSSRACKYCNGSGQITENIECLSLPECYAASKKLEALEAERSELTDELKKEKELSDQLAVGIRINQEIHESEIKELRNKVIEEIVQILPHEFIFSSGCNWSDVKELLNSLKTK